MLGRRVLQRCLSFRAVHSDVKVGFIGAPFNKGQKRLGVELGPDCLRQAGIIEDLKRLDDNSDVRDYGDVIFYEPKGGGRKLFNFSNFHTVNLCNHNLSEIVGQIMNDNMTCLTVGGDHSIAAGSIAGHLKARNGKVSVLWVDAHADINTNLTSYTASSHGMSAGMIIDKVRSFWTDLPEFDWLLHELKAANLAYIGLRDVDDYERAFLDMFNITAFSADDVQKHGIERIAQLCLEKINPNGENSLHVSFDIDALDPLEAPCTGTPCRGGLTLREGIKLMQMVHETGKLGAMDLVEINPLIEHDKIKMTVDAAKHIVLAAFGKDRKGQRRFHEADLRKLVNKR